MDITTFAAPIIEAMLGLLTISITIRMNTSDQNFYLTSIFGILKQSKLKRFMLWVWYLFFFSLIISGVIYTFANLHSNVTGNSLNISLENMTTLVIVYGLLSLSIRTEYWSKPKANLSLIIAFFSEVVLSLILIIAWYVGFVLTLTISIEFLQTIPEPTSGFYALIYIYSFIFLYFTIAFYIVSSSLKPAFICMANAVIHSNPKNNLRLKIDKKEPLQISWISKMGVCVEDEDSIKIIPWKSLKSIQLVFGKGKKREN